jgi:phospholipid/cholesterol/gamma-HCH transport system ATP-binding protein
MSTSDHPAAQPAAAGAGAAGAPGGELVIEVRNLTKRYGRNIVHQKLDFDVRRGEIVAIVGGSGSGKTTLVRQILGLERPTSGTIKVFGEDTSTIDEASARLMRTRSGMLFQQGALFSSMTVFDNIAQPLRELGRVPADLLHDIVMLKLEMVGLPGKHASKMPAALSGGMIKRVGIARAIALEPELLFLDEPTAGLDPQASDEFVELIGTLHRTLGLTVVMVTHDLDTMVALSTRVAVLADRKVLVAAPVEEAAGVDHPFIHEYFLGLRGRRALQALPPSGARSCRRRPSNRRCRASSCRRTHQARNPRMENKSHAFWAGLFTIALTLAIAGTVFWFNVDRTVRVPYDLLARTNVTGLFPDAAVRFRGLDVGKVQSIGFDRTHPGQIRIRFSSTTTRRSRSPLTAAWASRASRASRSCSSRTPAATSRRCRRRRSRSRRFRCGRACSTRSRSGDVLLRQLEQAAKSANELMSPEMRAQLLATAASLQHAAARRPCRSSSSRRWPRCPTRCIRSIARWRPRTRCCSRTARSSRT